MYVSDITRSHPAGILQLIPGRGLMANISNPFYAVAGFLALTILPYFVPLEYMAIVKVYGPGTHLFISAVLAGLLLSAYALYAGLFQPRLAPMPLRADDDLPNLMFTAMRAMMLLGLLANLAIVLYALKDLPGGVFAMKRALADFEGVNILSQSYLFALGPFLYLAVGLGKPWKRILLLLAAVLFVRGFIMAERLALLEFAIPALVVLSLLRLVIIRLTHIVMIGLGVPALFVLGEIFRSFYAKFVREGGWNQLELGFILQWNLERLALYYIDTLNKFYFQLKYQYFHITEFYAEGTLKMLSRLGLAERPLDTVLDPLVSSFNYGAEEMTNPGGLAVLLSDFGWVGLAVFAVFVLILFATHWLALRGGIVALGLYPILYLTMLEMPRFVYLYLSRALFPFLLFLGVVLLVSLVSRRTPSRASAEPPGRPSPRGA